MIGYLVSYRVAHKVTYIVTSCLPYALLFFLCRELLRRLSRRADAGALIAVSLLLAFLVGFFFEASDRHDRLLVPGGDVAPVHRQHAELLHLGPHVAAGPAAPASGRPCSRRCRSSTWPISRRPSSWARSRGSTWSTACWARRPGPCFFMVLARWLYRLGLRRYSAYGG